VLDLTASKINLIISDLASTDPTTVALVAWNATSSKYDITLDNNAAGAGWYIDSTLTGETPDSEFVSSPPAGIDLLTVLMHELGHVISIDHPAIPDSSNLMNDSLAKGVRLNPTEAMVATGLSSDVALAAGLDEFGDWALNLGTRIDTFLDSATSIPFTDLSLADLMGVNLGGFGALVNSKVDVIAAAIKSYFDNTSAPGTNDMLLALQGLAGVHVTAQPGLQQFSVTVDLATYSQAIVLDLSTLSLDLSDYGDRCQSPAQLRPFDNSEPAGTTDGRRLSGLCVWH
jgi:hypothetical protein